MGLPAVMTSTTVRGLSGDGVGCVEQSEFGSAGHAFPVAVGQTGEGAGCHGGVQAGG